MYLSSAIQQTRFRVLHVFLSFRICVHYYASKIRFWAVMHSICVQVIEKMSLVELMNVNSLFDKKNPIVVNLKKLTQKNYNNQTKT